MCIDYILIVTKVRGCDKFTHLIPREAPVRLWLPESFSRSVPLRKVDACMNSDTKEMTNDLSTQLLAKS